MWNLKINKNYKMTHSKCFKIILLIILVLPIVLLTVILRQHTSYNWDTKVEDYISTFNCEFICLDTCKDDSRNVTVYKFQTNDALQIEFQVRCFWGDTLLPFGFHIPFKEAKIVDDFAEQLCVYMSETEGIYNIEDKSVEEISDYVLHTVHRCKALFQQCGIKNATPNISFTFIRANESYTFKYGNLNETMLHNKLTKLLYE